MNEQEKFWAGEFGDAYVDRNTEDKYFASKLHMFTKILEKCSPIHTVIEFGANIGLNLKAIETLLPGKVEVTAVEINRKACDILFDKQFLSIYNTSILEYPMVKPTPAPYDLVLASGVLIHQNPDTLPEVYDIMSKSSRKYVCLAEYYNPVPVAIPYRGHEDKLFKRDFAGEFLDRHSEFELIAYEFMYHRDPNFPLDDATWFLMRRKN